MARPSKFTPEIADKIVDALKVGAPPPLAARSAGISLKSLSRWVKKGEAQRKGVLRDFFLRVVEAQGRAMLRWLAVIDKAALAGNWKAASWKLEHAAPEFFRQSAGGAGVDAAPRFTFEELLAQLEKRRSQGDTEPPTEIEEDPVDP